MRRSKSVQGETVDQMRARRVANKVGQVRDRRRFQTTSVPLGETGSKTAPADATGTIFPRKVSPVLDDKCVLIDGANQCKIGGDVMVGRLKGARIYTLTLEERATCPKSCALWTTCYGNGMQWSTRWKHGKQLEDRLRVEVDDLIREHGTILIRLHILGDFYSREYVCLWAELLDTYPGLNIFGFTAWKPDTEIGRAVAVLRGAYPDRFAIRHSNMTGPWGSFTINFPTDRTKIGDAVVCPEQRDAMNGDGRGKHCGNCALCWQSSVPVGFVEH